MTLVATPTGFASSVTHSQERATNAREYGAYAQHEIEEIRQRADAEIAQLQQVVNASNAVQQDPDNITLYNDFCDASSPTDLGSPDNPYSCFLGHRLAGRTIAPPLLVLVPSAIRKAWAL